MIEKRQSLMEEFSRMLAEKEVRYKELKERRLELRGGMEIAVPYFVLGPQPFCLHSCHKKHR